MAFHVFLKEKVREPCGFVQWQLCVHINESAQVEHFFVYVQLTPTSRSAVVARWMWLLWRLELEGLLIPQILCGRL